MIDKRYPYVPQDAVPPGATILETMEYFAMSRGDLARDLCISEEYINELLNGEAPLTDDIALGLERVLGIPAHLWSTLERNYQELRAQGKPKVQVASPTPA